MKNYNRTKKQRLKDRYHGKYVPFLYWENPDPYWWSEPVKAWFRRMYNGQKRAQNKQALYKVVNGKDDAPFASEKRSVRWDWY